MHRHDELGETPAMFDDGLVGAADQDELRWRMGSDLHEEGWPHNVWCMFRGRMGGAANRRRETEDDRDLMDGRNLMDDAPRWKRRP